MRPRFVVRYHQRHVPLKVRLNINQLEAKLAPVIVGKLMPRHPRPKPSMLASRFWFSGGLRFSGWHQQASKKWHAQRERIYRLKEKR